MQITLPPGTQVFTPDLIHDDSKFEDAGGIEPPEVYGHSSFSIYRATALGHFFVRAPQ